MAGEAKTNNFMLGTATVMIGAMSDVFNLNPTDHSIGLVKNFQMQAQPGFTNLTQGVKNQLVYSVHTSNDVRASMEVYEFTAKNLAYALGLDGSGLATNTAATTLSAQIDGDPAPSNAFSLTAATGFAVDDYVMLNAGGANGDNIIVRKIATLTGTNGTFDKAINKDIASGAAIKKVSMLRVGSKDLENIYLAAKVVGRLANGEEAVVILPKIKVTAGFTLQFQTSDYGNLPLELTLFDLVATDPNYADFASEQAKLYIR